MDHILVHYETAGAENDAFAGSHIEFLLVLPDDKTDYLVLLIDYKRQGAGFVLD